MKQVVPGSSSQLLRATHVLLVRVEQAKVGPWAPASIGVARTVEVDVKLEGVFKGTVTEPVGSVFHVALSQHGTGTSRIAGVPGVWSHQEVAAGARFVVLSSTSSESAPTILRDPQAQLVATADTALVDVQLAAEVEHKGLDVAGAVALAKQVAPKVDVLFAEYLWGRFGDAALADEKKFDPIADLLEQPALGRSARGTLIPALVSAVTSPEPPPPKQVARLAVAFFHLLAIPEAAPFHDNLVGTYLPTLLNITDPAARHAADVFHDHPGELAKARAALATYKGSEPSAPLLAWLNR